MILIEGDPAPHGKLRVVMALVDDAGTVGNVCIMGDREPAEFLEMLKDPEFYLYAAVDMLTAYWDERAADLQAQATGKA